MNSKNIYLASILALKESKSFVIEEASPLVNSIFVNVSTFEIFFNTRPKLTFQSINFWGQELFLRKLTIWTFQEWSPSLCFLLRNNLILFVIGNYFVASHSITFCFIFKFLTKNNLALPRIWLWNTFFPCSETIFYAYWFLKTFVELSNTIRQYWALAVILSFYILKKVLILSFIRWFDLSVNYFNMPGPEVA